MQSLSYKLIQSSEELDQLRPVWQELGAHPTADLDFCRLIAATRREILRPHVVAFQQGGSTVAILAGRIEVVNINFRVGYKRIYGVRARSLTVPYGGVLGANSEELIRFIFEHILDQLRKREVDLADLDHIRVDSPLFSLFRHLAPWYCRSYFPASGVHWKMALPASLADLEKGMSKKHRYWIRRMRKHLQERFVNEIEFIGVDQAGDGAALADQLEAVARHTYQRGLGVGFVNDEEHRKRLELWSKRGLLRAYLLRVQGKPVAFCLGTRLGGTFFLSHTAFVSEMSAFEPGTLVFLHMVECLCREGVKTLDFGLGDAFYKQRFGTENWRESALCLFAPTLKGLFLNLTDTASRFVSHSGRSLLLRLDSLKKLKKKWRNKLAKQSEAGAEATV